MSDYAVALGMFDSVHIGHKAVLDEVLNQENCRSRVITFDAIPSKSGGVVLTEEEKREKLIALGIDTVTVLSFEEIKNLSPKEFLDVYVNSRSNKKVVCGFNFRFGKNALGDTETMKEYFAKRGVEFSVVPEVKYNGETVSTTRIKKLLGNGDVKTAALLLDEPFSITAQVIEGDKRGRILGFPTINQIYSDEKASLRFGVYETAVEIDQKIYKGVTNIGIRPTFKQDFVSAETYIIDYDEECYGNTAKVSFIRYLREEKKFGSTEELTDAISKDIDNVKKSELN